MKVVAQWWVNLLLSDDNKFLLAIRARWIKRWLPARHRDGRLLTPRRSSFDDDAHMGGRWRLCLAGIKASGTRDI